MPRRACLVLPNQPLHVTQRGVNRAAIFLDDQDRHHYRRLLRAACSLHGVAIHAFVLMDNHVHLLLTPPTASSLAQAMRISGQSNVQAFNARHRRSGTLWQGRFNSWTVCRYIELNPVRAAMVARPEDYRWSSVHTHLGTACDPLISLHPLYLALGSTIDARATAYREWLDLGVSHEELADIRRYIGQQRALGDPRFQAMVEKTLNRTAVYRPGGRPKATGA
ncbi:MAG: transposase [Pseudomonadota bacterium]|nr:transposase [Pseudomonadota bacterium]